MKVFPLNTMIMRVDCGSATCDGMTYELAATLNGSPLVRSGLSGRWFALSWADIVDLARDEGVDAIMADTTPAP